MPTTRLELPRGRSRSAAVYILCLLLTWGLAPMAWSTTVVPPAFEDLVRESDYVLRGRVTEKQSRFEGPAHDLQIYTYVTLEVLEVLAGQPPETVELRLFGGVVEGERVRIEGVPELISGTEYILFVQGNGRQIYPLVAWMHGQYPIVRNPATNEASVARANGLPLRSTAEVSRPMTHGKASALSQAAALPPLSLEQFQAQIRAAARPTDSNDAGL